MQRCALVLLPLLLFHSAAEKLNHSHQRFQILFICVVFKVKIILNKEHKKTTTKQILKKKTTPSSSKPRENNSLDVLVLSWMWLLPNGPLSCCCCYSDVWYLCYFLWTCAYKILTDESLMVKLGLGNGVSCNWCWKRKNVLCAVHASGFSEQAVGPAVLASGYAKSVCCSFFPL